MPYSIRTALDRIVVLQQALSITDPTTVTVKAAYKTFPDQAGMPEAPCFINVPSMQGMSHTMSSRQMRWQVRSQILVDDANRNRASDIVLALLEKYLNALSEDLTLNGQHLMLGESSTGELSAFDYAGKSFTGIEITVPLQVPLEAVSVGP